MAKDLLELTYDSNELDTDLITDIVDAVVKALTKKEGKEKYVTSHRYGYKDMDAGLDALDDKYGEDALVACALYSSFFTDDPDYLYDVAMLQLQYLKEMGIIDLKQKVPDIALANDVRYDDLEKEMKDLKEKARKNRMKTRDC